MNSGLRKHLNQLPYFLMYNYPKKMATYLKTVEINKNIVTDDCLVGSIKETLRRLLPLVEPRSRSEWNSQIEEWKTHIPAMYTKKTKLHPKFALEYVYKKLGDKGILVTEVGQHQMWAAQFYPFSQPRSFITSGGLGTMGFGTGAAIGAQLANPGKKVVHFAGDGSFRMNSTELATIFHYQIPIIILVINNGPGGRVRQWQKLVESCFMTSDIRKLPWILVRILLNWQKLTELQGIVFLQKKNLQ